MRRNPYHPSLPLRRAWQQAWLAVAVCLAGLAAAAAVSAQSGTAANPPYGEHRAGKFIFAELVTPDLASAKRFYGTLFGWTFRDQASAMAPRAEAYIDGVAVAGLSERRLRQGETRQPAWLSVMAVADVDAADRIALAKGARVLAGPLEVPGRGRLAVLADPQGAVFGVMSSRRDDGQEALPAPGEWIWHTLFTNDHDAAVSFYQDLVDYEVFPAPQADTTGGMPMQTILASGGYARASANGMPSSWSGTHPHWLGYIRVADAAESAARAVALGGRLLVPPRVDRHGGRLAVIADPQGAPVGLLEWSAAEVSRRVP